MILTSSEKVEIGHLLINLTDAVQGAPWIEGWKIETFLVSLELARPLLERVSVEKVHPWERYQVGCYFPNIRCRRVASARKHRGEGQKKVGIYLVLVFLGRTRQLMLDLAILYYRFCVMPECEMHDF